MARILVISFSDLARDPRVDRQITFLQPEHEVIAAGLTQPSDQTVRFVELLPDRPTLRDGGRLARSAWDLVARRGESVYWRRPSTRESLRRLTPVEPDLIVANDLEALPLACRVAAGRPVIFDAHELSFEEHGHNPLWRALYAPYADTLLRRYLPLASGMMTVSPGIAEQYATRYGVTPEVVTSAPAAADLQPSPVDRPIRLIHHGIALAQRQPELMIQAMDHLDDRYELTLMLIPSSSRYYTKLERLATSHPRVRLVGPVPQRAIVETCNAYDIGVALFPPVNANLRYVLPNKLFEFIQARLAVAIGPSPDMAAIVREHDCGVVSKDFTAQGLAETLSRLTPEAIMAHKRASDSAAGVLNAEANQEIVLHLVDRALA